MGDYNNRRRRDDYEETGYGDKPAGPSRYQRSRPGRNQRQPTNDWATQMERSDNNRTQRPPQQRGGKQQQRRPPQRQQQQQQQQEEHTDGDKPGSSTQAKTTAPRRPVQFKAGAFPVLIGNDVQIEHLDAPLLVNWGNTSVQLREVFDTYRISGGLTRYFASAQLLNEERQEHFRRYFVASGVLTGAQSAFLTSRENQQLATGLNVLNNEIEHVSAVRRITAQIGFARFTERKYRAPVAVLTEQLRRAIRLAQRIVTLAPGPGQDAVWQEVEQLAWLPTAVEDASADFCIRVALQAWARFHEIGWLQITEDLPVIVNADPPWWLAIPPAQQAEIAWIFNHARPINQNQWVARVNQIPVGFINAQTIIQVPRVVVGADFQFQLGVATVTNILNEWSRMILPLKTFFECAGKSVISEVASTTQFSNRYDDTDNGQYTLRSFEDVPATELALAELFPSEARFMTNAFIAPGRSFQYAGTLGDAKTQWLLQSVKTLNV
jgi:hypothetical protein